VDLVPPAARVVGLPATIGETRHLFLGTVFANLVEVQLTEVHSVLAKHVVLTSHDSPHCYAVINLEM